MTIRTLGVKRHNIIIERWAGELDQRGRRDRPGFRWTVTYEKDGIFQVQGYEDTHASARAAAEACLHERGIDTDWLSKPKEVTDKKPDQEPGKPRWTRPRFW